MSNQHYNLKSNLNRYTDIVDHAYEEAIDKIANLTGLNLQECYSLLRQQITSQEQPEQHTKVLTSTSSINNTESQFISNLFH